MVLDLPVNEEKEGEGDPGEEDKDEEEEEAPGVSICPENLISS